MAGTISDVSRVFLHAGMLYTLDSKPLVISSVQARTTIAIFLHNHFIYLKPHSHSLEASLSLVAEANAVTGGAPVCQ